MINITDDNADNAEYINYKQDCSFDSAVNYVLENEDGLNTDNLENDDGGLTNHGISLRFLKQLTVQKLRSYGIWDHEITEKTIKDLTKEQAKLIYKNEFWLPIYNKINSQHLCNYIFDTAINLSPAVAHKIVQRALWAVDVQLRDRLLIDGVFGEVTLSAVNHYPFNVTMTALIAERAAYYRAIVASNISKERFLSGWLNRAYRFS